MDRDQAAFNIVEVLKAGSSAGAKKGWEARKGMRVVHKRYGPGTLTSLSAGPGGDLHGVLFDNPTQKMLGAMPVKHAHLTPMNQPDDPYATDDPKVRTMTLDPLNNPAHARLFHSAVKAGKVGKAGTSEGAKEGWETKHANGHQIVNAVNWGQTKDPKVIDDLVSQLHPKARAVFNDLAFQYKNQPTTKLAAQARGISVEHEAREHALMAVGHSLIETPFAYKSGTSEGARKGAETKRAGRGSHQPEESHNMLSETATDDPKTGYSPKQHANLLDASRGRGNKAGAKAALAAYEEKNKNHMMSHEDLEDADLLPEPGTFAYAERHKSVADEADILTEIIKAGTSEGARKGAQTKKLMHPSQVPNENRSKDIEYRPGESYHHKPLNDNDKLEGQTGTSVYKGTQSPMHKNSPVFNAKEGKLHYVRNNGKVEELSMDLAQKRLAKRWDAHIYSHPEYDSPSDFVHQHAIWHGPEVVGIKGGYKAGDVAHADSNDAHAFKDAVAKKEYAKRYGYSKKTYDEHEKVSMDNLQKEASREAAWEMKHG